MKAEIVKTLTISLPASLYEALEKCANEQERSKGYLVRKALEIYLKDYLKVKKKVKKVKKNI